MPRDGVLEEMQVYDEFALSEMLYVACLETLLSAYIVPLSNTLCLTTSDGNLSSSHCGDHSDLLRTFGDDVLQLLSCHRAIINGLRIFTEGCGESDSNGNFEGHERSYLANRATRVLRRGVPAMRAAYQRYVMNFNENARRALLAKSSVPQDVWRSGYGALAQDILTNSLLHLGVEKRDIIRFSEGCNLSLEALSLLPMQHIARYPLYMDGFIQIQRHVASVNISNTNDDDAARIAKAEETLAALIDICSTVNATRASVIEFQRMVELQKSLELTEISSKLLSEGDVVVSFELQEEKTKLQGRCSHGRLILLSDTLFVQLHEKKRARCEKHLERIPLKSIMSVRFSNQASEGAVYITYNPDTERRKWRVKKQRKKCVVLFLPNEAEALIWASDITRAVSDLTPEE
ncbi:putative DNA topoisomerase III [Trypanosoma cruzi]|uniref:DNA topoisomerase III n=1 Tax=Trypanosoma cruzi Dm28c TaxID=1416333 RepID=V5BMU1_TRYCR|nr:DNA topoisomerase III [Trypanosoma cruzi Dm28c]PBJ78774.1 DNA topoisomerase III [Trypanosoma cruzi cruzi]RNF24208.1 putative DNA topoisomerase III [Trypanosoma cruzi]